MHPLLDERAAVDAGKGDCGPDLYKLLRHPDLIQPRDPRDVHQPARPDLVLSQVGQNVRAPGNDPGMARPSRQQVYRFLDRAGEDVFHGVGRPFSYLALLPHLVEPPSRVLRMASSTRSGVAGSWRMRAPVAR